MQTILITGGHGDLARLLAETLSHKYQVIAPSRHEMDVAEYSSVTKYLKETPLIDVVINNAGSIHSARILEADPDLWRRDIEVNLIGVFNVCHAILSDNPRARILNISSTAAFNAYNDWSSYCASKAGVVTLTKSLAADGYDIYCLCPGGFDSKFRSNFNIDNPNLMTIQEAVAPIISTLEGQYDPGDIVLYRKDQIIVNP